MSYDFKIVWEVLRAVLIAAAIYIATLLARFTAVSDWHAYLVAAGVGLANVAGAAVLGFVSRGGAPPPAPAQPRPLAPAPPSPPP